MAEHDQFRISTVEGTNIIDVAYAGGLTREDEEHLHTVLDALIAEHGSVRVLARIGHIAWSRIEPAAAWLDAKGAKFLPDVEKAALVSEPGALQALTGLSAQAAPGIAWRSFGPDDEEAALAWLRS